MTTEDTNTQAAVNTEATASAPAKVKKAKAKSKPTAKKAAKVKAKPTKKTKPASDRLVPADLENYTVDKDHKTVNGNPSVHCGDKVAKALLGKSIEDVIKFAATKLQNDDGEKETVASLTKRYKHLNPGMQRMNIGNRLRAVL